MVNGWLMGSLVEKSTPFGYLGIAWQTYIENQGSAFYIYIYIVLKISSEINGFTLMGGLSLTRTHTHVLLHTVRTILQHSKLKVESSLHCKNDWKRLLRCTRAPSEDIAALMQPGKRQRIREDLLLFFQSGG